MTPSRLLLRPSIASSVRKMGNSSTSFSPVRLAILDDYSGLARRMADWSSVEAAGVDITVFNDTIQDEAKLVDRLKPFTIITAMRERTRFPASLIAQLPNLRLLTTPGMRNLAFDLPALADQSVLTLGCKGVPAGAEGRTGDATNEHCWGLILAATKGIVRDSDLIKSGAGRNGVPWQSGTNPTLRGKTLSILGFGRLGQALLPVARAFGFRILVWSPNLTQERITPHGDDIMLAPSLQALLSEADVLTLQIILSPSTRHIIGKKELGYMKKNAFLVNTSRGPLVDEDALVEALREKTIRGAALDVFDNEPFLNRNPFEGLDNVTLTPHMGYLAEENMEVWWKETVENVESWLEDGGSRAKALGRELKP